MKRAGRGLTGAVSCTVLAVLMGGIHPAAWAQGYVFGRAQLPTGAIPRSVVTADLNIDGQLDLAVADYGSSSITVFLGKPDGTFAPGLDYPVGRQPDSIAEADFNGDGIPDLAVADAGDGTVSILLGNGDGTFQTFTSLAAASSPTAVAGGDFNHDGKPDLVVASGASPGNVAILLGNGDGSFQPPSDFAVGNPPAAMALGDLNADGNLDLAVADEAADTVSILLGKGDGTFQQPVDYAAGNGPVALAEGNFNSDGVTDLAVADQSDGTISVLLGNGDGSFETPIVETLGGTPSSIVAGDFNQDGYTDVAVAGVSNSRGEVVISLGKGDGTFQSQAPVDLSSQPAALSAGDFNGDRVLDLAIANQDTNTVTVLIGQGKDVFPTHAEYTAGGSPRHIVAGDFNQDGVPDLATTNWGGGTVSVLMGNGDGTFKTHVDFPTDSSPFGIVAGDFNGDGRLDLGITAGTGPSVFSVFLGKGDGTFQPRIDLPLGIIVVGLVAGDFNGDGKLDVGLLNGGFPPYHVSVYLGNGNGTFRSSGNFVTGEDPTGAAVGDFNRDGKLDIATASTNMDTISILLGNGDGTFLAPQNFPTGYTPYSMVAGDFNGDGNLDLATADLGDNTCAVLMGKGDGTFGAPVEYQTGNFNTFITTADIDGDGKPDLLVSNRLDNTVSILSGNGDGTFKTRRDLPVANGPEGIVTGDFNGDGGIDIATANYSDSSVSVFLNNPVVALFPPQISFTDWPVGTTSLAQEALLSNPGSMPFNLSGIAISGDFAENNNCGTAIPPGANCKTSVTFSPTGTGDRTGALVISDSVPGSPHSIALSGTGTAAAPVVSLSSTALSFVGQSPGSPSPGQAVTLTNNGNAGLNLGGITISGANAGDFSQSNNCGTTVNVGASCTIQVGFTPTVAYGTETATLTIADNAFDSPQTVSLTGTIAGSTVTFSPTRLYFPSQPVGTTSAPAPVSLTVSGGSAFSIQSITTSGDFAQTNNCGTSIPGNGSCTINVTFSPKETGNLGGSLTVVHLGVSTVIALYGSGGDFSLTASNPSATITAGGSATFALTMTTIGGFDQTLGFSCSGAPQGARCSLPASFTPVPGRTGLLSVIVYTTARSVTANRPWTEPHQPRGSSPGLTLFAICALALLGIGAGFDYRRRPEGLGFLRTAIMVATLLVALGWTACGGGATAGGYTANSGTPAGTYTLTVAATYNDGATTLTHNVKLTLKVN